MSTNNYNKFKSTTVYGSFQNSDLDTNNTSNANAIFDRNVSVKGVLESNDASFNTIKLNGNITSNSLTITPTQIGYLKDASSNIQSQINNLSNNYVSIASLPSYNYATKNYVGAVVSGYTTTSDLSNNYVTNTSLTTQLSNYCIQSNYTALKTQADATTLLLSNTQYINGFGLNWYGAMNVFGGLLVTVNGNTYLNVGTILNSLPTTYCSISSYNSLKTQADATTLLLTGGSWSSPLNALTLANNLYVSGNLYVGTDKININLIPTTYVSNSSLTTTLSSYITNTLLTSTLSSYITSSSLTTTLVNYATKNYVGIVVSAYTTTTDLSNNYVSIASLPNYNYATKNYVGIVVSAYTTTTDLSNNYVTNSSLTTQLTNYCLQTNYTSLKSQVDATQLLLTGASWDGIYNYLNLTKSVHIFGTLVVGLGSGLNVYDLLNNLPTTYATIVTLNQSLLNYITNSSLNTTLSSYATNSSVDSKLSSYATNSSVNSKLSDYVLTTTLSSYVTSNSLSSQLNNFVTNSSLSNTLSSYVTNFSLSNTLSSYATSNSLNNYCLQSNYTTLKTQADLSTLLLTGGSWSSPLNALTLANNLYVSGSLYVGVDKFNLNLIPTTYVSNSSLTTTLGNYTTTPDLSNNYVKNSSLTTTLGSYVLSSVLSGYVTSSSLTTTLSSYVTNSSLTTTLGNYVLSSVLSGYVTASSLATTLSSYVTNSSLTSTLSSYVTNSSLTTSLSSYVTNSSLTSTLSSYVTNSSLTTTLGSYALTSSLSNFVTSSLNTGNILVGFNNFTFTAISTNNLNN